MATDKSFAEYVQDQAGDAGPISIRKMFGEYALYWENKVVALICDNQLFVKPTEGGRALIDHIVEAPPYPGAKPHLLVGDELDDRDWLAGLLQATAKEVPEPKPKKAKAVKRSTKRL